MQMSSIDHAESKRQITTAKRKELVRERDEKKRMKSEEVMRGVMTYLEKKIGRRLVWLVFDLNTGELPLRHLIQELDGPTTSHNKWSGPLGNKISKIRCRSSHSSVT